MYILHIVVMTEKHTTLQSISWFEMVTGSVTFQKALSGTEQFEGLEGK